MSNIGEQVEKAAVELAQARERLQAAQSNFDRLLKTVSEMPKQPDLLEAQREKGTIRHIDNGVATREDQLMELLNANPKKSWSYMDALPQMTGMKLPALRVLVFALKKKGRIVSPGYGRFKTGEQ
jgi:hypothetical protein